jgi:hypothetical protein
MSIVDQAKNAVEFIHDIGRSNSDRIRQHSLETSIRSGEIDIGLMYALPDVGFA